MSRSRREVKGWQKIPAGYKRAAKRFSARRVRRTSINDAPYTKRDIEYRYW